MPGGHAGSIYVNWGQGRRGGGVKPVQEVRLILQEVDEIVNGLSESYALLLDLQNEDGQHSVVTLYRHQNTQDESDQKACMNDEAVGRAWQSLI